MLGWMTLRAAQKAEHAAQHAHQQHPHEQHQPHPAIGGAKGALLICCVLALVIFVVSRGHGYGSVKEGEKVQHAIEAEKRWAEVDESEREAANQAAIARTPQPPEDHAGIAEANRDVNQARQATPIEGRWKH